MMQEPCVVCLLQIVAYMGGFETLCAKSVESFIVIQFYFLECHKDLVYNVHCFWLCKVEKVDGTIVEKLKIHNQVYYK